MQAELHLARAIKEVGGKIIAMLAQIEEFQKKLWLKRKIVTSTNYLVTLDKIVEKAPELLPQIGANDAQREERIRLFAIDEITADSGSLPAMEGVAYSEPLTEEFLRANDKLVVDTRFFDREFVATLLAGFDDIDEETDGLLVHSENFQALNLLQERYREKMKCISYPRFYHDGFGKEYRIMNMPAAENRVQELNQVRTYLFANPVWFFQQLLVYREHHSGLEPLRRTATVQRLRPLPSSWQVQSPLRRGGQIRLRGGSFATCRIVSACTERPRARPSTRKRPPRAFTPP